jgi:hypothetical protein
MPLYDSLSVDWQRAIASARTAAARLWERPAPRYAVDHGPDHADRVVALLDGLTTGLMTRREFALAPEEIYVLLTAAYLHAIGLQDERSEADLAARWARYPELGAELVYRALEGPDAADLGLRPDPGLVEMIALVVGGHRQTDCPSPDYDNLGIGNVTVRPRLLTAVLCLADGLDLDYRRVDLEMLKVLDVPPEQSLDWWLHHYVSGVQVRDEYVRITYRVPVGKPDYERALPELVEHNLRAEFRALRDTFRLYGVKVDLAPPTTVRPMRTVKPLPSELWAVVQRRLAHLRGETPSVTTTLPPLAEKLCGLLSTMGYDCAASTSEGPLSFFTFTPRSRGLRPPLLVGCKAGAVEVADVLAVAERLETPDQQGYVVAERRLLPTAQEAAQESGRVRVFTLAGFYRELLDFSAYVESLVDDYESSELAGYYVDLGCVRYSYDERGQVVGQDRYKPLDDYIYAWQRETGAERNHISILGDYGTGKTSFCRQYAAKQGRRWLADPDGERLPLLINLRDYTKTLEVESLITNALVNQYGIQGVTFEAFCRFNADGKLLLLFDGFDEMAQRTGVRTAVDNFWELAQVVAPGTKVILTCRTPYFRTHHEAEALLYGRMEQTEVSRGEYIDLRDRPNFEIVHLEPFSDDDIQAVLRARFPDRWQAHWAQVQSVYNLPDLARRPVLLDMIARTLPELKEDERINAARLYQVYTGQWLERDAARGRTLVTSGDRRLFAEGLAMEMLHSGELAIHYSRIPEQVKAYFCLEKADEIDYFEADVRTCNFLNRDDAGDYSFAHKSFLEFFCACRLHRLMLADRATADGPVPINEEVRFFIRDLFVLQPKEEPDPPCAPPEGSVWVPPGEYILGGELGFDVQVARLEQGFFIGRAPVTNSEYVRFVAATNHEPPKHWRGGTPPQEMANHPVVYVSWHDAVAYAEWAGGRLPSQEEWEKAARGSDGRAYPWGDDFDPGRCNTKEGGAGTTTPVDRYSPQGDSPYGATGMAGNVWEWTASEQGDVRVLRGGSFDAQSLARCAFRLRSFPDGRFRLNGFRVVVSHLPALHSGSRYSGTLG